jgi:hypothetical protein
MFFKYTGEKFNPIEFKLENKINAIQDKELEILDKKCRQYYEHYLEVIAENDKLKEKIAKIC